MNIFDLLVIYFSIGAPFGVYVYFLIRGKTTPEKLWLKTLFTFFFWAPTAARFLLNSKFTRSAFFSEAEEKNLSSSTREQKLYLIQKHLEEFLMESDFEISIYEFRNLMQRYAGLTFAAQSEIEKQPGTNKDFFEAAQNKNPELAAQCFQRRNRKRLFFHQTLARQDFLQFVLKAFTVIADKEKFARLVTELVQVIQDWEAQIATEKILAENLQRKNYSAVNSLEKDLWKPPERKLPPVNSISTLLLPTHPTATLLLPKKD